MRNNSLSLLSGRVKKTSAINAASDRYTWIDLKNTEPDAGVPTLHASTRGLFGSDINGTRQWFYADAGLSVDTSTGFITVNEDTVYIDTSGFINTTSDNLHDVLADLDANLGELGNNALVTVSTDDTIDGGGTVGAPLSIGQGVRWINSPEFAGLAIHPDLVNISGINLANPIIITTSAGHGLTSGDPITIEDVEGTTELNGNDYYVNVSNSNTFTLYSDPDLTTTVNGTSGHSAYVGGGVVLSGGYNFPESDGDVATYLKTDGSGNLTFDRPVIYGGSSPSDPDLGDLWFDFDGSGDLLIWNGTVWYSTTGGGQSAAFTLRQFAGDGTSTQFDTLNPQTQRVLVFLNGVLMRLTDDFTWSTGIVTFNAAPRNGDTIEVLLTGNASLIGLDLLGIANHDLITVDSSGNVTFIGELDMGNNKIVNLATPTANTDAATKAYVDSAVSGNSVLTYAADGSTSGTVTLGSQTFTLSGTANEVVTSASGQTLTIGLPSDVTIANDLTVDGNLTVNGATTTLNTTVLEVEDLNITVAKGAASAAAANGAGLTVDGASATITYDSTNDEWDFNKGINVSGNIVTESNGNAAGIYTFQKTIATSSSNDIFTIANTHGAQVFTVMFNCSTSSMSVAKHYTVVHQHAGTPVSNLTANTGPYSGQDFTVSFVDVSSTGVKCSITNNSTTINADITVTLILGGSPTAVTITEH